MEEHRDSQRPPSAMKRASGAEMQPTPLRFLAIIITGISIAETIAMIVVYFYRFLPYPQQVLLDALVMVIIISPLLYLLSTKPLLQQIKQRAQTERLLQARLTLIQYAGTHVLNELLQFTLDQIEDLTHSRIGYFHFLESDQKTLWLRTWSTNTLQSMCTVAMKETHYDVDKAGVWTDCIRARHPVIHNDYASLPHRRGLPEGHAPVIRELAVPIMREGKIVAILGVGNKPQVYTENDVEIVSTLADFAWEQILHKQAVEELFKSEQKFRTLVDWTYDWEFWVDPQGNLVYTSPACERTTGYSLDDFIRQPELITSIIHPEDRSRYANHRQIVHNESAGMDTLEYRILSRAGEERWIEHICRPLFGADDKYLGRRVSNRDITDRKLAEQTIHERNEKEKRLTQTIHTMQLDIARDLHDTIGQNISYLRMKLDFLAEKKIKKQAEMQLELRNMARAANESYDLVRGTLALLQSENSTDLFRLFTRYAEQIEERSSFKMDFSSHGDPRFISAKRMRQLFYIFREILNNIEKHANATEVGMELTWNEDALELGVTDNGCGFDPHKVQYGSHYGLKFLRERADLLNGSLTIQSAMDSGTHIKLRVPYE
jgi:PAS domain S-box-containing protein